MGKYLYALTIITMGILSCNNRTQPSGYWGKDITGEFELLRDRAGGLVLVSRHCGSWTAYAGATDTDMDRRVAAAGDGPGSYVLPVEGTTRHYVKIETADAGCLIAERRLPLEGADNFRDLGGLRTGDGRYLRWGLIYRSDALHDLTESDMAYLSRLPLRTIIDFRSQQEAYESPDKIPASVDRTYALSLNPGNLGFAAHQVPEFTIEQLDGFMERLNMQLVSEESSNEQYRKFFRLLEEGDHTPLVFHCTAGKDRTGMAAALFLSALGVDMETIMEDYLSSNTYLADKYAPLVDEYPALRDILGVRPEFIGEGLKWIRDNYGTVERYMEQVLTVNTGRLKELYLY